MAGIVVLGAGIGGVPKAFEVRDFLGRVCKGPGPMVMCGVQGAFCFGPEHEYALTAISDLRKRKIRHRVPVTFVTSEPNISETAVRPSAPCRRVRREMSIGRTKVYWGDLAKVAFETYFMRKGRIGSSEPGYERYIMKTLRIERMKAKV